MKKFIIKTAAFILFILAIIVSVNYWGDAAKIFHSGYEKKIASILFKNQNVKNMLNYDDRILQKEIITNLQSSPDLLILGSSRTMFVNSTFFNDKKFINNSVSGASIEDLIAIYQMYKTKNILPKKIILGIDPWLLNENNGQKRWQALRKEYFSFSDKKREEGIINNKVKQLFSFSYFKASFKNLPNVIHGKSDPIATKEAYNYTNTKLIDGSVTFHKNYREVSDIEINNKAKKYISGDIYALKNFESISPKILKEFKDFCQTILTEKIELSFFIAPYHPIVYDKIKEKYKMVLETENKIIAYANQNNIKYFGSFNPIKAKINSQGFYDGMHCKESSIQKILQTNTINNTYKSIANWD